MSDSERVLHNTGNEAILIAAALSSRECRAKMIKDLPQDAFVVPQHQAIWAALKDLHRRDLDYSPEALRTVSAGLADVKLCETLRETRPEVPSNFEFHLVQQKWDVQRLRALTGPVSSLIEEARKPNADPSRCRALAEQTLVALQGNEDRKWLYKTEDLVRRQMAQIDERIAGRAVFPYGIDALDRYSLDESGKFESLQGQARCIPGTKPGQVTVLTGASGNGKALASTTMIPTPSGWKRMGDLLPGDYVFDENGAPTRVIVCTEEMTERDCYRLTFSDGAEIIADEQHQWVTLTNNERAMLERRTQDFREKRRLARGAVERRTQVSETLLKHYDTNRKEVPERGNVRTTRDLAETLFTEGVRDAKNHSIALASPLQLPPIELPLDPYVLGVWLGDGNSRDSRFTSADPEIADAIRSRGFEVRRSESVTRGKARLYNIIGLKKTLRNMGVLEQKHIPPNYLRASYEQRLELLRGLMDTDGCCGKSGQCEFSNCDVFIARGFGELLATLGIKCKVKLREAKLNGKVVNKSYRFLFSPSDAVFFLPRKLARQRAIKRSTTAKRYLCSVERVPSVPVKCIQVESPSGMYLVGEKMVPTHNSTLAALLTVGVTRQRRRVLHAAWEPDAGDMGELIACISLNTQTENPWGINLGQLRRGDVTKEERDAIEERMSSMGEYVTFMGNPFFADDAHRESGNRVSYSNDRNLDILSGYIADSGCDVVVLDLWERCLVSQDVEGVTTALFRTQRMAQRLGVHLVLLAQQRMKDTEARDNKRPTREAIKGTSAWVDVADTIVGIYRPGLYKDVGEDIVELIILKQRWGLWPMIVECQCSWERGVIGPGKTRAYEDPTVGKVVFGDDLFRDHAAARGGRGR